MSGPYPNRNRENCAEFGPALARAYRQQPPKTECAQKELNLQPAGYYRYEWGRVIVFAPRKDVAKRDAGTPTEPEASRGNRNGSVTEPITFLASGHKAVGSIEGTLPRAPHAITAAENKTPGVSDLDSQQPYALSSRPDILGYLEGVTLAVAMGSTRVWR